MADAALGRGVIELVADARKLRAGVEEAKKSLSSLGNAQSSVSKAGQRSITDYIAKLQQQNATFGKSTRETELYRLALKGASDQQLKMADAALRVAESNKRIAAANAKLKEDAAGLARVLGVALVAGAVGAVVVFEKLIQKAAGFQDLSEKVGASASALASLSVAAKIGGVTDEALGQGMVKLAKNLTGVDDDAKAAGAALSALGINIDNFKKLSSPDQIEALAKAFNEFEDSNQKASVAVALLGRGGAELLPFFKELATGIGRVNILTDEQIAKADEYADKHARAAAVIELHAARIASEMVPALDEMKQALLDVVGEILGVGTEADKLGKNNSITEFARSAIKGIAVVVDVLDGMVRGLQIAGKALAAFAAIATDIFGGGATGFGGIKSIITNLGEDALAIANRPFLGKAVEAQQQQARVAEQAAAGFTGPPAPKPRKKRLDFEGAQKKDTSAESIAKAQLALDLENIRRAADEQIDILNRSQNIMEARKAADLINDREYYASKLAFINLLSQAQEKALQDEIARLQKETFTGKNADTARLENKKAIAEAEFKLRKVQGDAVAAREINAIQEAAANEKVRQSYLDAKSAADAYIETITRRNRAEVEGIGKGNRFREEQQGLLDIEQRFAERRRQLEGERRRGQITQDVFDTYLKLATETYHKEVRIFQDRTADILASQNDWTNGAKEALANYIDEVNNAAKLYEDAFSNSIKRVESDLTEFFTTGKIDLKSFGTSIVREFNSIFVKQRITGPLTKAISDGGLIDEIKRVTEQSGFGGFFPLFGKGTQAPAPVVSRDIGSAATQIAGESTIGATITASGAEFSASVVSAGATFTPEIIAAGTQFAGLVAGAGAEFAAAVAASSAGGAAGEGAGLIGDLGSAILGSFASGTEYVPKTGLYELHQGERVVPAGKSAAMSRSTSISITQMFAPGSDRRTVAQAGVETARQVQRELSRSTA